MTSALKLQRLHSLDALRGFDMLWIIGGETVIRELAKWQKSPSLDALALQFTHVPWEGLRAYDLIFPLFMFLSGVAIPFSLDSKLNASGDGSKLAIWRKIFFRCAILILLGMFYNGVFSASDQEPRFASVLGQIGIAWGIAASLHILIRQPMARLSLITGWLMAIAIIQLLLPVPGDGAGNLSPDGAVNAWLDRALLPGRLHGGTFDPEGLLCVISAAAVTMAGAFLGSRLMKPSAVSWSAVGWIAASGTACLAAGILFWNLGYPPVKALWTSTFNLMTIGISLLLFAVFFFLIDVLRFQKWSFPLRVIGMNPLTIYLLARMISFRSTADLLFGRFAATMGDAAPLILACGVLVIEWALLYFLYRNKWFLRV